MKVLNESHSELRLKRPLDKGMALFMAIWGSGFIAMPIVMMVMILQQLGVTKLSCDRPEPALITCQHQQSGFLGLQERPATTYTNVTEASLQTLKDKDDEGQTTYEHWVALATAQGEQTIVEAPIMVNGVKGDPVEMEAIANQISQFIQSDQPQFALEQDNRQQASSLFPLALLLTFPAIGIAVLYFTLQSEELIFDRELGSLQRHRSTLFGRKSQDVPLHSIKNTEIQVHKGKHTQYRLKLLPQSLKTDTLMSSRNRRHVDEIETKVKQFLQLSHGSSQ